MLKFPVASQVRLMAALSAICLMTAAATTHAQNPQPSPSTSGQTVSQAASKPSPDDELLASAAKLYYSSAKAGLNNFTCAIHPDWHTVFISANKGATIADDDPRMVLLKSVKITLHARLQGGSTVDWKLPADPGHPLDANLNKALETIHSGTEQTLQGFIQFWTPFIDGSVIPANSEGVVIAKTEKGHRIQANANGTSLDELIDDGLVLREFDVVSGGAIVNFAPSYKSTDQGLLVSGFHAHVQPPGVQPDRAQEMNVEIDYQTLRGFPIPARINVDVVNSATFNFLLDGCSVNR
jgi:hypothetical protein